MQLLFIGFSSEYLTSCANFTAAQNPPNSASRAMRA
jgi:hypothetical protein